MSISITADYKKAFKDADIRGLYPTEIDEEVTYLVARAFVDEYSHKTVLVARDMRLSSPALHQAFLKGVTDAGAKVIDIGLVSTPMLYFASGSLNLPGVVITASHSPKNYNGLKLVLAGAIPLTEKHGLRALRKRIEKGVFKEVKKPGLIQTKDISQGYLKKVLKGLSLKDFSDFKVLVDCGNGMAGVVMPLIESKLPGMFKVLGGKLDGTFPERGSDPTLAKNQKPIKKELRTNAYDFGVSFDGDADRIAFFDETGTYINSACMGGLIAHELLKKQPAAKIVYTNLTSLSYEETIKASGGKPVLARVGHAFIKEKMRQRDAIFGAEHSGHLYFKEYFYTDSVILALGVVLNSFKKAKMQGRTFSEYIAPYCVYKQTEDVIVMVNDSKKSLALVLKYLKGRKPQTIRTFDGYSFSFGDVWGTVKASVTEPALKIICESKNKSVAQKLQTELVTYIKSIAHL